MKWTEALAIAGAGLSGVALGVALLNAATWPRGKRRGRMPEGKRVSVLIPARDEADTIELCVRSALSNDHPVEEVIVCDDQSTDGTTEILDAMTPAHKRLRTIKGAPLPQGWVGKPFACHRLASEAKGDILLFVDADTFLEYEGISRIASLFAELDADIVTAVPRQQAVSFWERLILPLLHLTYTSWFPIALTWRSNDVRFLAANGQVLAITREAYEAIGGFESVRDAVVDDMAICRRVKAHGGRVVFADGHEIAVCRMYTSGKEVIEGFSKNIYPGLGAKPLALAGVIALYGTAFIGPYVVTALGAYRPHALPRSVKWLGWLGVAHNVALRALLARRHEQPPEGMLTQPLGVLALIGIALNSARWTHTGQIRWSGRTYSGGALTSGREELAVRT